jgi:hypothetical protein
MSIDELIRALALPESTRLNQRVPKKLLAEQEVATAADKRQIQDGVDEVCWLAALKPHLIGVPAYDDHARQYLELAVLRLTLKPGTKPGRLVELLHRAVPYPVLLLTSSDAGIGISLVHLRRSQNEADKTVLDSDLLAVTLPTESPDAALADFCAAFPLAQQPQVDLHALYQGWMDTVAALDIARETGRFQPSRTREQAAERHQALQQCRERQATLRRLQAQAQKERQLSRLVALNVEIRGMEAEVERLSRCLRIAMPEKARTGEET